MLPFLTGFGFNYIPSLDTTVGIDFGSAEALQPKPPAEGLMLASKGPPPEYLPTREELRARLAAGHLPRLPDDVGPHEPYAPGWRPGQLRRERMTALAWAVVR